MEQRHFLSDGIHDLSLVERLQRAMEKTRAGDKPRELPIDPRVTSEMALAPAAVLMAVTDRPRPGMILTRRASHMRKHAGQVAFPGGRMDDDDADPVAAALREAWEEIALPPDAVTIIGTTDIYKTWTGFEILPVLAVIPPDLPLSPHEAEVESVFEAPLDFLLSPANHAKKTVEVDGTTHGYYEMLWDDYRIWGVTARILVNLSHWLVHDHPSS